MWRVSQTVLGVSWTRKISCQVLSLRDLIIRQWNDGIDDEENDDDAVICIVAGQEDRQSDRGADSENCLNNVSDDSLLANVAGKTADQLAAGCHEAQVMVGGKFSEEHV